MSDGGATKFQFRLDAPVVSALTALAQRYGYEVTAYMQKVLVNHAIESGLMEPAEESRASKTQEVIEAFISLSQQLYAEGRFDEHFQRTVFLAAMEDATLRSNYEIAVGGPAFESGLPGKTPLNMYLGWYIKNAIGVDAQTRDGKPVRTSIRNAPIQSYTLLQERL
ncbi:MAG: hypothetical protein EOQ40_15000 [Mesorhizobium sp.]|uniref:hypothetical protein n=1 Tax=Mesorhizobium sp. TaxID=1871066 RepID=UPI000FE888A5|nr:hypothetical protein [Mesorhizobium sp.]RWB20373.1 MAG: hypothetical protein EOQ40_15000 [Mesorhizobium sp.]